jgi:hypothetical protein
MQSLATYNSKPVYCRRQAKNAVRVGGRRWVDKVVTHNHLLAGFVCCRGVDKKVVYYVVNEMISWFKRSSKFNYCKYHLITITVIMVVCVFWCDLAT